MFATPYLFVPYGGSSSSADAAAAWLWTPPKGAEGERLTLLLLEMVKLDRRRDSRDSSKTPAVPLHFPPLLAQLADPTRRTDLPALRSFSSLGDWEPATSALVLPFVAKVLMYAAE
jgi:hypothetical protein